MKLDEYKSQIKKVLGDQELKKFEQRLMYVNVNNRRILLYLLLGGVNTDDALKLLKPINKITESGIGIYDLCDFIIRRNLNIKSDHKWDFPKTNTDEKP